MPGGEECYICERSSQRFRGHVADTNERDVVYVPDCARSSAHIYTSLCMMDPFLWIVTLREHILKCLRLCIWTFVPNHQSELPRNLPMSAKSSGRRSKASSETPRHFKPANDGIVPFSSPVEHRGYSDGSNDSAWVPEAQFLLQGF